MSERAPSLDGPEAGNGVWLGPLDAESWSHGLDRFADANFYQTWAYGAVSWGQNQLEHLVLRRDGIAVAIAQVRRVRLPPFPWGIAYVRWGPCCQPDGEAWSLSAFHAALEALIDRYVKRRGWTLRLVPPIFDADPHFTAALDLLAALGFRRVEGLRPYRTIRLDLSPPLEVIRKRLDGKWRNQLNAAERQELRIVSGTDLKLYDVFLRLYDEMMARKRFDSSVNPRDFRRIQAMLPERQKMRTLVAYQRDVPQAAAVSAGLGRTGIYVLGATGDAGTRSKASYLIHWHMIEHLKIQGYRWYDLGGINPEANPGVYHFKSGLGGEVCAQCPPMQRAPRRLAPTMIRWAERLVRSLPRMRGWVSCAFPGRPTTWL